MLRWALAAALALAAPPHLLEGDALPPEVCARIIDAAERQGFSYAPDTIDRDDSLRPPSVQLEVFEQDEVRAPEVMALVAPYLPRLRGLVDRAKRAKGVDTPTPSTGSSCGSTPRAARATDSARTRTATSTR